MSFLTLVVFLTLYTTRIKCTLVLAIISQSYTLLVLIRIGHSDACIRVYGIL